MIKSIYFKLMFGSVVLALSVNLHSAVFTDCFGPYKTKWASSSVTFKYDASSGLGFNFPSSSMTSKRSRLFSALLGWNGVNYKNLNFTYPPAPDYAQEFDNGENEIYLHTKMMGESGNQVPFPSTGGIPAAAVNINLYTGTFITGGVNVSTPICITSDVAIIEADIAVNAHYLNPYTGVDMYNHSINALVDLIAHEIGHGIGFEHEWRVLSQMMPAIPFGGHTGRYHSGILGDDRHGARSLYWSNNTARDLAVSPNTCCEGNQFTKRSKPIRIMTSSGNVTNIFSRGEFIRFPWTVHNLGTTEEDVQVKLFLTSNPSDLSSVESATNVLIATDYTGLLDAKNYVLGEKLRQLPNSMSTNQFTDWYPKWIVDFNGNIPTSNGFQSVNNKSIGGFGQRIRILP